MGTKKVKIQLYEKNKTKDQIMSSKFGDYILDDICVNCVIEEDLGTSGYFLDAEFLVDNNGLYKNIVEETTLKVQTDYGTELFSIVDVRRTPSRVVVFGRQITISESIGSWLEDVRPENKNGLDALVHMQGYSIGQKNLEFESDISVENTAYYQNQSLYNAIHISDNCFQVRWGGEIRRRSYKMIINERIGNVTDVVIRSGKNLTGFEAITNIDSIVTRIKPVGFNGRTIDGYIDSPLINNYKYIKTQKMEYPQVKLREDLESEEQEGDIIFDTIGELQIKLTELALLEYLNEIDVLQADYTINFIDLSTTEEYKNYAQAEAIQLGDYINVYEEKHDIKVTVRALSRKYNVMSQRVEEIVLSNKTAGNTNAPNIETIKSRLDEVVENVGYMNVTYAKIKDLESTNAEVENLKAVKADVVDLQTATADIGELNSSLATIQTLVNGNLTSENIQSLVLSSDKVTVNNGFIKNAMIDSLSADKISSGSINTNKVSIQSNDGSLALTGNLIQFKDTNNTVRIQIGKDASGNFTFVLYDEDGQGQLINQDGITASAISDGLIVNSMVSNNAAISGSKLDINSVIKTINENGTESIDSSRIYLDEQQQTLQVAFNNLQDQVEVLEIAGGDLADVIEQVQTNTTNIEVAQGQIESLISSTTITKEDGTVTQLKDEFNTVQNTVDSHTQTISSMETNYDSLSGDMEKIDVRTSTMIQNLDSISASITDTSTSIDAISKDLTSLSNQVAASITSEEVSLQIQSEISNINIGRVTTSTGYTFNEDGLTIEKSDSEMSTQITDDGMTVYKNDEAVLTANNVGVDAVNLHATTYLIVGNNSRFEDYGDNRTGCFFINNN